MEKIIINYSGWISVDKNDLKIQSLEGDNIDITKFSGEEVINLLKKGNVILSSFADTYKDNALDGEDDFNFDVEID
jgi:hypothetical protein